MTRKSNDDKIAINKCVNRTSQHAKEKNTLFSLHEKLKLKSKFNDILTIGELLIDMVSLKEKKDYYVQFFGGSPANIALNTKMLGANSIVCSAVGKDRFGEFLTSQLKAADMDTGYIQYVEEPTSLVVSNQSNGTPKPLFYRMADYKLKYTLELESAIENSKILHFSTWPISMEPARHTMEQTLEKAKQVQTLICFDPNFHPAIWKDPEEGKEYTKSIISKVDIIKPSEDDAERIFGADKAEAQVEKFIELGAKLVIMTLGKEGAIVSNGSEFLEVPTLATEVVNTTGAGDAFWAGFYASVVNGDSIKQAVSCGSAASAFKLKHLNSVAKLPDLQTLKEGYKI